MLIALTGCRVDYFGAIDAGGGCMATDVGERTDGRAYQGYADSWMFGWACPENDVIELVIFSSRMR